MQADGGGDSGGMLEQREEAMEFGLKMERPSSEGRNAQSNSKVQRKRGKADWLFEMDPSDVGAVGRGALFAVAPHQAPLVQEQKEGGREDSASIEVYSTRGCEEGREETELTESEAAPHSSRRVCTACGVEISGGGEAAIRTHYRLDWHRNNVKRRFLGRNPLSEADFEAVVAAEGSDLSSISASEDDEDDEDDSDGGSGRGGHRNGVTRSDAEAMRRERATLGLVKTSRGEVLIVRLGNGRFAGIQRCLVQGSFCRGRRGEAGHTDREGEGDGSHQNYLLESVRGMIGALRDRPRVCVLLASGGHFAGAIFDGAEAVVHKSFHRYVTRRKAGGRQSQHDKAGGKGAAKSAGAQIRRHNEAALERDVASLLESWAQRIADCQIIFYRAAGADLQMLYRLLPGMRLKKGMEAIAPADEGGGSVGRWESGRFLKITIPVRRPTFAEVTRVHAVLLSLCPLPSLQTQLLREDGGGYGRWGLRSDGQVDSGIGGKSGIESAEERRERQTQTEPSSVDKVVAQRQPNNGASEVYPEGTLVEDLEKLKLGGVLERKVSTDRFQTVEGIKKQGKKKKNKKTKKKKKTTESAQLTIGGNSPISELQVTSTIDTKKEEEEEMRTRRREKLLAAARAKVSQHQRADAEAEALERRQRLIAAARKERDASGTRGVGSSDGIRSRQPRRVGGQTAISESRIGGGAGPAEQRRQEEREKRARAAESRMLRRGIGGGSIVGELKEGSNGQCMEGASDGSCNTYADDDDELQEAIRLSLKNN